MADIINQEDPIILYIIVRDQSDMNAGKVACHCATAIQKMMLHYFAAQLLCAKRIKDAIPQLETDHIKITSEWIDRKSPKEIRKANESEWDSIKLEFNKNCVIISDSPSVICLWPAHDSQTPIKIKQLLTL